MFSLARAWRALLLLVTAIGLGAPALLAAPKVYVGNFQDNTVSVLDLATDSVVATIPVTKGPHGIAATRDGRWVLVSGDGSSQVSVIDAATDKVVRTVEVGKSPHGITVTPDGKLALVAVNGQSQIAYVDLATLTVVARVAVPAPHTVGLSPDGKTAYVSAQEPGHLGLAVLDVAARKVVRTIPLDKVPRDVEFGFGGKAVYYTLAGVNAVQVLNPQTEQVSATIPTGISPHVVIQPPQVKFGLTVVQGVKELLLFDPQTDQAVRSFPVDNQPHWVTVTPDGGTAVVTNEGSNDVTVITLATGQTRSVAVGKGPRKVAVLPQGQEKRVSISGFQFNPAVVTIPTGASVVWRNDDGAPHAVSFGAEGPEPTTLLPGQEWRRSFDRAGTYAYQCAFHAYMRGQVVVVD